MSPNSHFKELLSALNSVGAKYPCRHNDAAVTLAHAIACRVETPTRNGLDHRCRGLVGRTPWSAAGPLAGFLRRSTKADEGVGRGPGGPPHQIGESLIFLIRCARRRIVKSFLREF